MKGYSYPAKSAEYYQRTKIHHRDLVYRWNSQHPAEVKAMRLRYNEKLKAEVLTHYGNGKLSCVRCGESDVDCLSIDHIKDDGMAERKKLNLQAGKPFYLYLKAKGFPEGYQTLCMNCQFKKKGELLRKRKK